MSATLKISTQSLPKIDLLNHLFHQKIYPKFYWNSKGHSFAALGKVASIAQGEILPEGVVAVGAFPFETKDFSDGLYVPEYLIEEKNGVYSLTCFTEKSVSLKASKPQSAKENALQNETHVPEKAQWNELIVQTLANKKLKKVVLGRTTVLTYRENLSPYAIMEQIKIAREKQKNSATLFLYQSNLDSAFLGASPEKLFSLKNGIFESEALAGTLPLASKQPWEEKERREFAYVKGFIEEQIAPIAEKYGWNLTDSVKETASVKHLYNKIVGEIKSGKSAWDLLRALHPTPAMAGIPQKAAVDYIYTHETRGYFTGPIGWMSKDSAEFAVSIRCCTVLGNSAHLHAAAGILEGSDPAEEWEELNIKMETVRKCLR